MESTIRYSERPELDRPILIEGLPGVGNVGKIVADYMAQKLDAKHFASVISKYLPPQVLVNQDNVAVMASNELFYAKDVGESHLDVIFLLGDFQATTPEGQFKLCEEMMDEIFLKYDVSTIFTLGGYGTGQMVKEPRVLGVASDLEMKKKMEPYGIEFAPGEPAAGIVGASGIFIGLGQFHGIEAGCIMGETSGYFVDYRSGLRVLAVMEKILGITFDKTEMEEKCQQIDELEGKVLEYQASQNKENLGYFG
ncbi:MAG: proteasome assembly chaperone family protein [Candidatus Methanomethylophilaceae archaeon]|nr:proteasome assembly chaperone family protein [Thermoplasmata archaeon]MBQ2762178.1 proteasome assembly chaperone family protein [Candidatus Methanomethylophilaceae archaeon]